MFCMVGNSFRNSAALATRRLAFFAFLVSVEVDIGPLTALVETGVEALRLLFFLDFAFEG